MSDTQPSENTTKKESGPKPDLIAVQEIVPSEIGELDLYQKREKIYTRKIEGFFQKIRVFTGWPLLLGFFLMPWLQWGDRQMVLFDLPERQFHILGLTFWPQDFSMLGWLLIIAAFALFLVTVIAGRVWCGYTCPQTVWTSIFMWMEQLAEGSRNQRMKMDKKPWSAEKLARKVAKHSMWIGFSFLTGFAFVSYFYPARELIVDLIHFDLSPWALFWLGFFTWTTNINAGWLREQVCMYMCPYARFQSVMFDHDTLIVSYDPNRGEPRGARKRGEAKQGDAGDQKGDCVDCQLCVQVCPTGIDIRNGLQYQCIGCALCIDACNSIMDKMNYPRGLISYTTEHQLDGGKTNFLRPRLIGYALMLTMMVSLFIYNIATRQPIEIDIIRDRNALYTTTNEGYVENIYTLKIMNMDQQPHSYTVSVSGMDELTYIGENQIHIGPGEVGNLPLRLKIDPGLLEQQTSKVFFSAIADDNAELSATEEARFIGPTQR